MKSRAVTLFLAVSLLLALFGCAKVPQPDKKYDKFYYAVVNSNYLSADDALAIQTLLHSYDNHEIVIIDAKDCPDALALYEKLKADRATRPNTPDGIQIFGSSDAVPTFWLNDKVALPEGYATGDAFASDYFYSNFENDSAQLENFSVADYFEGESKIDFLPHWRVARLALGYGEFSAYIKNYQAYWGAQNDTAPLSVCFSSSIFPHDGTGVDDMAVFLNRAVQEWKILDRAHLYANQQGDHPSSTVTAQDCSTKNIVTENKNGVCEFYFSGHGSQAELFRTVWEAGKRSYSALLDWNNISSVLSKNPYFLNIWACNTAEGLDHNLIRTALKNGCLGAFAATAEFNNNGVSCLSSKEEMSEGGNFFYFYYSYLSARQAGLARTRAFLQAQREMASALSVFAQEPIDYAQNYQMVYANLLSYANIGVLEPDASELQTATSSTLAFATAAPFEKEHLSVTTGKARGAEASLSANLKKSTGPSVMQIKNAKAVRLDNDHIRFLITISSQSNLQLQLLKNEQEYLTSSSHLSPRAEELMLVLDLPTTMLAENAFILAFKPAGGAGFAMWEISGIAQIP